MRLVFDLGGAHLRWGQVELVRGAILPAAPDRFTDASGCEADLRRLRVPPA